MDRAQTLGSLGADIDTEGKDSMNLVESLDRQMAKPNPNIPELRPGDIVRVHIRIVEGQRERVQVFQGIVIGLSNGGANRNFTVRRIAAHGVGVERTFLMHSPRIERVEVLRHSKVRRSKLYYLRERRGKSARLKQRFTTKSK
jgi:large subunit ribosomal protein L19